MQRYDPKPWDIRRCDMVRAEDGRYVRYDDANAEIERLKGQAKIHHKMIEKTAADAVRYKARSEKSEAERDQAVAAAFEAAADVLDTHGDSAATEALGQRLCCSGQMCGCQGSTVGDYLQHLIRALTPADAQAALEAYGREKVREGMNRAADIGWVMAERDDIRAAILAEMEKLK